MTSPPEEQLRAYVDYLRDMGIYDLYRRDDPSVILSDEMRAVLAERAAPAPPSAAKAPAERPKPARASQPAKAAARDAFAESSSPSLPPDLIAPMPKPVSFDALAPLPVHLIPAGDHAAALQAVRDNIGDCTRCPLAYAGRRNIVFADGDPNARLMFVGEGPGADEDASGVPFVGKAGQLLNNMIAAMGLKREEVYIANVVKCRPPGNRTPEPDEANTCTPFLFKQIDAVRPQVLVALGATAATYLLGQRQPLAGLRGRVHPYRGMQLIVTYHPAYLLRDPRQKKEAWADLQIAMRELGLRKGAVSS